MNNPFSLENKRILVTGASSGIGQCIAIECSKMGAQMVVTARNQERLHETVSQIATSDSQEIGIEKERIHKKAYFCIFGFSSDAGLFFATIL